MMTEEILYARLKDALRDAIARHHLDERSISLKSRGLTPEEAIGRTARTDYPILNGREVMLQARFGEALGQAFTSAPVDFEGSLADVLELGTTHDPQAAGMLVATLNAVLRAVGEIGNTVHCRDDGPELCAERYAALVRERFGTPRIALVGFQPALLARLSKEFSVRVLDLNPEIVGTVRQPIRMWCGTGPSWCCARAVRFATVRSSIFWVSASRCCSSVPPVPGRRISWGRNASAPCRPEACPAGLAMASPCLAVGRMSVVRHHPDR